MFFLAFNAKIKNYTIFPRFLEKKSGIVENQLFILFLDNIHLFESLVYTNIQMPKKRNNYKK